MARKWAIESHYKNNRSSISDNVKRKEGGKEGKQVKENERRNEEWRMKDNSNKDNKPGEQTKR